MKYISQEGSLAKALHRPRFEQATDVSGPSRTLSMRGRAFNSPSPKPRLPQGNARHSPARSNSSTYKLLRLGAGTMPPRGKPASRFAISTPQPRRVGVVTSKSGRADVLADLLSFTALSVSHKATAMTRDDGFRLDCQIPATVTSNRSAKRARARTAAWSTCRIQPYHWTWNHAAEYGSVARLPKRVPISEFKA